MDYQLIISSFETLGLGVLIVYLIRGLKQNIASLNDTVTIQNKTLDVMEKRISETEKVGNIYKNLISDLPQDLENYKTILSKTKDETIIELKNQQESAQKKLLEAQDKIKQSAISPETIEQHLRILKKLLSKPKSSHDGLEREYDLAKICEFGDFSLEKCVPLLIDVKSFEEFLIAVGFSFEITEDSSIRNSVFGKKSNRKSPKGNPIKYATSTDSVYSGWFLAVNDEIYMNNKRLKAFKTEFNEIKDA